MHSVPVWLTVLVTSYGCDKNTWDKQFKGGKVYSVSWFMGFTPWPTRFAALGLWYVEKRGSLRSSQEAEREEERWGISYILWRPTPRPRNSPPLLPAPNQNYFSLLIQSDLTNYKLIKSSTELAQITSQRCDQLGTNFKFKEHYPYLQTRFLMSISGGFSFAWRWEALHSFSVNLGCCSKVTDFFFPHLTSIYISYTRSHQACHFLSL